MTAATVNNFYVKKPILVLVKAKLMAAPPISEPHDLNTHQIFLYLKAVRRPQWLELGCQNCGFFPDSAFLASAMLTSLDI